MLIIVLIQMSKNGLTTKKSEFSGLKGL